MVTAADRKRFVYLAFAFEVVAVILYGTCTKYHDALDTDLTADDQGFGGNGGIQHYYPMYQDVHVMVFVGFGFLMTFLKKYGYSSVGFNFLISALTVQWSMLVLGFWHSALITDFGKKIELTIISLIDADFAAATVMISFGALLGKVSPIQMFVIMLFEIFFYGLNFTIGTSELLAVDVGGSMFVHTFGAYFGLACSMVLCRAKPHQKNGSDKTSDMFAMIGTLFLWMYWPSFNGALAPETQQHRVVINTVLSLSASCIAAFLVDALLRAENKFDMVSIQNATLAGGVAAGSAADLLVGPFGALLIGFAAGTVSVIGYTHVSPWLEEKIGLSDTCGVHNLHGMPGILGGVAGIIASANANSADYGDTIGTIFPGRASSDANATGYGEDGKDWSAADQAKTQTYALLVTLGIAIGSGALTGLLVKFGGVLTASESYEDREYWQVEDESDTALVSVDKKGPGDLESQPASGVNTTL